MKKRNADGLTEKEFLDRYNPGDYERPSVTVDMMVLKMKKDLSCMQILLIKRKDHPCIGQWALPGGFVNIEESAYEAACRELKEETGLTDVYMEQLYTMSQPQRDPRMRVIDIAYIALLPYEHEQEICAGDDAVDALWFDIDFNDSFLYLTNKDAYTKIEYVLEEKIFKNGRISVKNLIPILNGNESLAFDHSEIVLEGLMRLKNKILYTDIAFNLVPEIFTLPDLHHVYEIVLGKELHGKNFRVKIEKDIIKLDDRRASISSKKPAGLCKYKGEE